MKDLAELDTMRLTRRVGGPWPIPGDMLMPTATPRIEIQDEVVTVAGIRVARRLEAG